MEIRRKLKGSESIDVAATLTNIGSVHYNNGEYESALDNYNQSLEIQTKIWGSESIDVA